MLRDFKIFRRQSSKNNVQEGNENLTSNPSDLSSNSAVSVSERAPLNTIQQPLQMLKSASEADLGHMGKIDRPPSSKFKGKGPDAALPFRTPEKLALRSKFGWAQKNDTSANGVEMREEGRPDGILGTTHLPPWNRGVGQGNGGFSSMTPRAVRNAGKVSSNHSESGSVWSNQSTPTKSVTKPPNPAFAPLNGSRSARAPNSAALSKGVSLSSVPSTVVNTMEVPHFELRENPSFWMDHNVQVLIRVRPLNSTERSTHGYNRCVKQESAQSIAWIGQPENRFTFDHVACETINQEMLFRVAGLPMVENCLSGYNSCIFAYGQTGSGKTYTMLGEIDELEERPSTDRGMTPRIFEFLFARIRAEEDSRQDEKLKYNCKCSFLEIYNEQVTDLLDPSSANLLLREDIRKGVYVENLTEFEVENVSDILKLLVQGASNRKVAATNMNRESSRSHSVFTCVIESRWEKDSTINLRFARLNLVDLAGSERQKTSGAEGERLKEAANINKSLSTLGHVIMLLVDVAHGKQRHVPYRDSRLTFLLQDSLGGNSKTMIIANVSPSICCAAETLSTLKFAQRAKLIQNNAVVNEDASGDVLALQNQIQLLKEELSLLKRQNVSRSLSFRSTVSGDSDSEGIYAFPEGKIPRVDHGDGDVSNGFESSNIVRVSTKQLKSLETTLAGAFRREKMADDAVKKLEAEIEQLNRLVRQREEDTRCTKMMLKFREDKIQRMKSLADGVIPADSYLLEENNVLAEEVQLLRTRVDKNPEVTRFALENIRLLDQLRRFQDFYEEGEREILLAEVSELRDQLIQLFDGKYGQDKQQNLNMASEGQYSIGMSKDEDLLRIELNNTHEELEDCRNNLKSCLELNAKLTREIDHLQSQLSNLKSVCCNQFSDVKPQKVLDSGLPSEAQTFDTCLLEAVNHKRADSTCEAMMKQDEKILNLELELDILKSILEEERVSRGEVEERICCELEMAKERCLQTSKQCASVQNELKDARCVIEALESQQFLSISEMEEIRERNDQYMELLRKQEQEISILKKKHDNNFYGNGKKSSAHQEPREQTLKHLENEDSPLQAKLRRMQTSLEKARMLNMRYQSDQVSQTTHDEEMDETRRQVEAETAEVIVCLQEELNALQQQVDESNTKELEMKRRLTLMEAESKELQERLYLMTQDNERLSELIEKKDEELSSVVEEWERLAYEIADILSNGNDALHDASDQVDFIADSLSQRSWISQQVERIIRSISEKDLLIEELQKCLEDAHKIRSDMEWKLRSLRGATLAITEAQQKESNEKEKELLLLTSQLNAKMSIVTELEERVKLAEDQTKKAEVCTAVALISVKRMSEINSIHLKALKHKELQLNESIEMNLQKETLFQDQILVISEAERQIEALEMQLKGCEEHCTDLNLKLLKEQEHAHDLEQHLEKVEKEFEVKVADDLLKAKEKLSEFKMGMHTLNSCMNEYVDQTGGSEKLTPGKLASTCVESDDSSINDIKMTQSTSGAELDDVQNNTQVNTEKPVDRELKNVRIVEDVGSRDLTIILLRKEIESALQSLKGVQAQMTKLTNEKEEANRVEKQSRESIECLTVQVFRLQTEMSDMEKKFEVRMAELNNKLQAAWEMVDDANACISEAKEVLELELSDTKVVAAQKATEASTILAKFEEAQETMKEADVMVNALVAANEASKLEIEKFKKIETALLNEVQNLQSSSFLKEQEHENLEKQFCSSLAEASNLVQALEDLLSEVQTTFKEEFKSIVSDIHGLKSQVLHSTNLTRTWLEDIWSEIVGKDCALSILHLCHIGILLEAVTGLNAENSFLQHGMCASNSVIADLRENNFRAKKELEMCSVIKGKLLIDIKNSFHRITRKEDEAGKLSAKLDMFEKKILDLQLQEELMVSRSNYMSSDLAFLLKELDTNNRNALTALLDQEKLLKERDFICKELDLLIDYPLSGAYENLPDLTAGNRELKEGIESYKDLIRCQMEKIMKDLSAKDFKLLILASELEQKTVEVKKMAYRVGSLEKEHDNLGACLEDMKKEMIFVDVEKGLDKQILLDKLVEVAILEKDVAETHHQLNVVQGLKYELLLKLQESSERIAEMDKEKKALEEETHSLKELAAKQQSDLSYQAHQLNGLQDLQDEVGLLHDVNSRLQSNLDEKGRELVEIKGCFDAVLKLLQSKEEEMEIQVGRKNLMSSENEKLKCELREVTEAREKLSAQVQVLKTENEIFSEDLQTKETTLECSSSRISVLDLENRKLRDDVSFMQSSISALQTELDVKTAELTHIQHFNSIADENFESKKLETIALMGKIDALELENEKLKSKVHNLKSEHSRVLEDLQAKKSDFESCSRSLYISEQKNFKSEEAMCSLEACVSSLQRDLGLKDAELKEVCCSRSMIAKELDLRVKAIETQTNMVNELKGENTTLRNEFMFINQKGEIVSLLKSNIDHLFVVMQAVDMMGTKIFEALDGNSSHVLIETMFQQICEFEEMVSKFIRELECLELSAEEIIFERSSLQAELVRKEDVLKGLQFDLSLLQESSSNVKDRKDEFETIVHSLESAENELALKTNELDVAVAHCQMLETQLLEKAEKISSLEMELSTEQESVNLFSGENLELKAQMEDLLVTKTSIEEELNEKCEIIERLNEELLKLSGSHKEMSCYIQNLKDDLSIMTSQRDALNSEIHALEKQLEMAQALAEENEAIAAEARQGAEARRTYAEEKEEEVKLLETSVEELERTINVLENKVEIVEREAERQRLQREELEMERQNVRHQMLAVHNSGETMNSEIQNVTRGVDDELPRHIEEKLKDLKEAQKKIQHLEKDVAAKDAEIAQCKAHISELNMHAEAQAQEYKQKFKALEAMAQEVKPEHAHTNSANLTATKSEKNAAKSRGSGSPFKCIGLGLTHQINSEKDEELSAGRQRIEELEALAASRQKEIFMLNARLAAAESMTHDVIRDLLGVKLDMTNYASLIDHQQVQKLTEKVRFHSEEAQEKEQEVIKLKKQLNEFIEERQSWLDEINRRHAEMVALQVALEKLRQRDHFLTTENDMLKVDNGNHKKKIMELEDEVKKLSGQQNLQQRIHHHAKVKEENNVLKTQNENLSAKLQRTEVILSRVKEELARYRSLSGKNPFIDIDEEQSLKSKLEDTEEERVQLAQKLLSLCTSILKAAGITRPPSNITLSVAEEALKQLKDRIASMEQELHDWRFKSKISSEKIRLSELRQQPLPLISRTDENCPPRKMSITPPLSTTG